MSERKDAVATLQKHGLVWELKHKWVLFLMLVPTVIFFLIFSYLPMVGIYFAFTRFTYSGGLFGSPFIGLDNFKFLFMSGALGYLTRNTILYNLAFIGVGNVLQIAVAILISRLGNKTFKKTSQSILLFPYVISYVIIQVFSYAMFNANAGTITHFVRDTMGITGFNAYSTPSLWPYVIVIVYLWKNLGYGMVIYLAAISGISEEYYEAAEVDGATVMQQIRHITLPMLLPTFIILLLLSIGSILRGQFELFYQLIGKNGLLYQATDILDTYVFRMLKDTFNVGFGTAAGLYQSLFGLVLILVSNWFVKRSCPEYSLF